MSYLDYLIEILPSESDEWFAWYPVRTGALGTGKIVFLKKVWRNRCGGITIYQPMEHKEQP